MKTKFRYKKSYPNNTLLTLEAFEKEGENIKTYYLLKLKFKFLKSNDILYPLSIALSKSLYVQIPINVIIAY